MKKKLYFIEDKNFLKKEQINFLENEILTDRFPWYHHSDCVIGDNFSNLQHVVKIRPEWKKEGDPEYNSIFGEKFFNIFLTFCKKNNVSFKEIFRIALNYTYNPGQPIGKIHQDHNFNHKQLIVYLNDPLDKKSETIILDDNEKIILKKIIPEKYKGICFENKPHYLIYPKIGYRIVIVYTFI
jgi:hypothetical protein